MAFTETPLVPKRNSPTDWTGGEPVTSARDDTGLFAYGFDTDTHADTGTRAGSTGWTLYPLESPR